MESDSENDEILLEGNGQDSEDNEDDEVMMEGGRLLSWQDSNETKYEREFKVSNAFFAPILSTILFLIALSL